MMRIGRLVGEIVRQQVTNQFWDLVNLQVWYQVSDKVWDKVRDQVWDQVWVHLKLLARALRARAGRR